MAFLEIRRHSHRKQGAGSQLSQRGVDLAREVGATSGPYAEVVTSVLPRTRETAIAMGYAVDRELVTQLTDEDVLAAIERAIGARPERPEHVFSTWARILRTPDPSTTAADQDVLFRWSQTLAALCAT